ncbi:hypothetical protein B0I35DRAFT_479568 [Stachybotrys elegans]|uniref:Uncharacterized protein n=1 Tax=Stachybotrys elegans TaxID=80388 RepID=A0A8K0SNG0_9HYPO|nr:hypothetical protein B0I35DRAFT_479568 [Stachybotrys elegans]
MASRTRQQLGNALLGVAIAGGLVSTIGFLLQLIAGSSLISHGARQEVILKDLAPISFNGILPKDNSSELLVHVYWFNRYFAWEYPTAPDGISTAGFTPTSWFSQNVKDDFYLIAADIDVPGDSINCHTFGRGADPCSNAFFEAMRQAWFDLDVPEPSLQWIINVLGLIFAIYTILQEVAIKYKPYWVRCTCFCLKSMCPCPKGTREEIEAMDDYTWDKVRLAYWALLSAWVALSTVGSNVISQLFLSRLRSIQREGDFDMDIKLGGLYEIVGWVSLGFSLLGTACILVKWTMSRRPKGWMEQQALDSMPLDDPVDDDESRPNPNALYKDDTRT